ncbi:MAG: hypothetical protein ABIA62_04380 [Candidatus Woesearchaeota archaeon]
MVSISLEDVTEKNHDSIRRRFLKGADNFYDKAIWDRTPFKKLAYTGMALGIGAISIAYVHDSPWLFLPTMAGLVCMTQAFIGKIFTKKAVVDVLKEKSAKMSCEELEKRVSSADYELPTPSHEDIRNSLMSRYALNVADAVGRKEYGIIRYPWTAAGVGVMVMGMYNAAPDNLDVTTAVAMGGSVFAMGSMLVRRKRLHDIARKVDAYIREKGIDHFESRIKRKDPYDFYTDEFLKQQGRSNV